VCDEGQLAAKAWLRLAEALEKLGCDGARDAYLRVKTLHPPLSAIAKVCHMAIGPNPNPNLTRRSPPSPRCATWPLALTLTLT
jgi:hypothetical protein